MKLLVDKEIHELPASSDQSLKFNLNLEIELRSLYLHTNFSSSFTTSPFFKQLHLF